MFKSISLCLCRLKLPNHHHYPHYYSLLTRNNILVDNVNACNWVSILIFFPFVRFPNILFFFLFCYWLTCGSVDMHTVDTRPGTRIHKIYGWNERKTLFRTTLKCQTSQPYTVTAACSIKYRLERFSASRSWALFVLSTCTGLQLTLRNCCKWLQ